MKVITPITITDALLASSTVAEPSAGETAWVSGTSYAVGDVRIRSTTHRKYQCTAAVSGTTPPENDATKWTDIGPTNKWAMFDLLRNSATVGSGTLTVSIAPGRRVGAIGLVGLVADSVTVTMVSGGSTVYTRTETLLQRSTTLWSEYFFGTFRNRPSVAWFDLPWATGATITITLTRASGNVSCGGVVIGNAVDLGTIQKNPTSDALNFSKVTRDDFGNATLVPRRSVPGTTQTLVAPKTSVDRIRETRSDLNAVPALWSGLDDKSGEDYFETLLILGIYKRFSITLTETDFATINLELEEI